MTKTETSIVIIANGFQREYIANLVWGISEYCKILLIGSNDYLKYNFNSNVTFINMRGSHLQNVSMTKKIIRVIKYYVKLFLLLINSNIRVMHIQWLRFFLIDGFLISLFARFIGIKVVYTAHDTLPHDRNTLLNKFIFWLIYNSQNKIIAHTNYIKQCLVKKFKIPQDKVQVVEHGLYKVQDYKNVTHIEARNYLNLNRNDFVILFFGKIAKYKGIETVINSLGEINREQENIKLVIAGKVSKGYENNFYKSLQGVDLTNIITKLYFIDDHEVELLFKASNVTAMPYREASQSGVLFLSYAYGVPVIVPKLGGFPDYVINNKTGVLFDPKNDSGFVEAVKNAKHLFYNLDESKRDYIKKYANKKYSWSSSCKDLHDIYKKHQ